VDIGLLLAKIVVDSRPEEQ